MQALDPAPNSFPLVNQAHEAGLGPAGSVKRLSAPGGAPTSGRQGPLRPFASERGGRPCPLAPGC
jgi:hypothetical protein